MEDEGPACEVSRTRSMRPGLATKNALGSGNTSVLCYRIDTDGYRALLCHGVQRNFELPVIKFTERSLPGAVNNLVQIYIESSVRRPHLFIG